MSREAILGRIRAALGRRPGQTPAALPDPLLDSQTSFSEERIQQFLTALHALNVKTCVATTLQDALGYVEEVTRDKRAICSPAPVLKACGIDALPAVDDATPPDRADVGITGVDYALANTGTLVMLASAENPRLYSLLPPVHVAVVLGDQLLASLDELYTKVRMPADKSSSMVLITGPSRTADIEQILVRGVHGPGELHVVFLRN